MCEDGTVLYRLSSSTDLESMDQSKSVISKQSPPNQRKQNVSPSFLPLPIDASSSRDETIQILPHMRQRSTIPASFSSFSGDSAAYFFNEYVFNESPVPTTVCDALPRLFHKASADSPLHSIIFALGMACYSNAWGVPEVMMYANLEYAKVLNLINSALRDRFAAKKDEVLLIVMLLALYEEVNRLLNWFRIFADV